MGKQVRFIHTADLHLGAPFKGLRTASGAWGRRMVEAIPEAYARVIDAAIDNAVDFVVIAGDIFDVAHPSFADYSCFRDGLERLAAANIPVYFCTGNHDPYTSWQGAYGKLPDSVFMFPPGDEAGYYVYERDGEPLALLVGRGYYNQTWPYGQDIAEGITRKAAEDDLGYSVPFAIGVLHTGLDVDPTKAPTDPAELLSAGMDYWALGHIHTPKVYGDDNPRIAFSGCIQGRAMKDTGARGVNLVTLTEGKPNQLEFIPTASVVWERVKVDVSSCATLADMVTLVKDELFRLNGDASCDEMIERITLSGTTPLHAVLRQPGVLEDLRQRINESYDRFYCDALIDTTAMPIDREKLLAEGLFPAVLLEVSESHAQNRAHEIAYLQQEFIDRGIGISNISEKALRKMERRAEALVMDLLGEGRDAR
ncbi:MAG: DNA repair exonuclease [Coriobacteriaceae bacterium]|nr:DNA repair exonuclease [Coriobacteriaceae bacterium]